MTGRSWQPSDNDRNLLFGVLALRARLIDPAQFADACGAWAADRTMPLADLLVQRGWLTPEGKAHVESLLACALKEQPGDFSTLLAATTDEPPPRASETVGDREPPDSSAEVTRDAGPFPHALVSFPPNHRGRYTLTRLHAQGGIGQVWLAQDHELGREVALKQLRPEKVHSPVLTARFLHEAQITGQLEHPGIVPVYELARRADGQTPFYTMRFVKGRTLSEASRSYHDRRAAGKAEPLEQRALLNAFVLTCNAVAYAHARGVIHRDLKGQNIVLGDFGEVIVLDWGIAKVLGQAEEKPQAPPLVLDPGMEQNPTGQGEVVGTPAYMAPEQAQGRPDLTDARTDVYGLGAILYEILTGRPPFTDSDTYEVLRKVCTEEPPRPRRLCATVPPALEAVGLRALAKEPGGRYASATELAREVQRWLADEPVVAYREPPLPRLWRWARRHKPLVAGAAALLLAAVVALAVSTALIGQEQAKTRQQRDLARERERTARQYWYVADLNLAQQAWEAADMKRVLELLNRQRPQPGHEDLRSFEWYYLWRLCHGARFTLRGHRNVVFTVAFAPDGRTVASVSQDGTVKLWDVAAGQERATLQGHRDSVYAVAYTSDGKTLATGSQDETVKLWDVATGRERLTLSGQKTGILTVAFTADGKTVASAGGGGTVMLWDTGTGRKRAAFQGHKRRVWSVAFAPDGRTAASGSDDGTVKLWEVATGQERATYQGHAGGVSAVAFAPDGQTLATGSFDRTVKLWDVPRGQERAWLQGHKGTVRSVQFAPDGKSLASGGEDRTVRLWDAATGRELSTRKGHTAAVWSVAFAPDGKSLASGSFDRTVQLWDVTTGQEWVALNGHTAAVTCAMFSPDGKTLATGSRDKTVRLWDVATGQERAVLRGHAGLVYTLAFSPDGRILASAGEDRTVKLWDAATGPEMASLPAHLGSVTSLAFSPDGQTLATASVDCLVKLWDVATRQERATLRERRPVGIQSVAFAPDGKSMACGCSDGAVKLWDVATGQKLATFQGHTSMVHAVAFTKDGKTLASASEDGSVRLWDTSTGAEALGLPGHLGPVRSLAFDPDGTTLATAGDDKTVKLWDLATGQERLLLQNQTAAVRCVAFAPNGKTLASGGADGMAKLWKAAGDDEVPLPGR